MMSRSACRVISAGLLLGTGMGGFVDGILLHQLLQWHNMLSSIRPPIDLVQMKYNMLWDGVFHVFTWAMVALGIWRLWLAGKHRLQSWSTRVFGGSLLAGWGLFNFVEGLIDHQILGIHHVHPGAGQMAWDVAFLLFGLAEVTGGWLLVRSADA